MKRAAALALLLLLSACGGNGCGRKGAAPPGPARILVAPPEAEAFDWVERRIEEGAAAEAVVVLERMVFADGHDAAETREMLTVTSFTEEERDRVARRLAPGFLFRVALARAYREIGGKANLLRAVSLVQFAMYGSPDRQWSRDGWRAKLEMCRSYLAYGKTFEDRTARRNVVVYIDKWKNLGVLPTPLPREWQQVYDEAKGK